MTASNSHKEPSPPQSGMWAAVVLVAVLAAVVLREKLAWAAAHWVLTVPAAVLLLTTGTWAYLTWNARRKGSSPQVHSAAKKMGSGEDLAPTSVDADQVAEVAKVSGMKLGEAVATEETVAAGGRDSAVAVMGPGAGKSASLVIPLALEGCVDGDGLEPSILLTTSNKVDVWNAIKFGRRRILDAVTWCFNPQNIAPKEKATWWWDFAMYVLGEVHGEVHAEVHAEALAQVFANATIKDDAKEDPYFDPEGQHFLADLLLAAALAGKPIQQAYMWLTGQNRDYIDILEENDYPLPALHAKSISYLAPEQRDGVFGVALRCVQFCNNKHALAWISPTGPKDQRPVFDPKVFVRSKADTLVLLSREGVGSFGPLVAAMTMAVTEAAEEFAEECEGGHLPRSMKVILDEVANVCRWKMLPDQFSHYPGRGIFLFAFLQSWAQGCRVWGKEGMEQMWSTATIKILGPGDAEVDLLKDVVELIGSHWVEKHRTGSSAAGGVLGFSGGQVTHSTDTSYEWRPIMEVADLHALPAWTNIVMASKTRPFVMRSLPYFDPAGSPLHRLVEESKARNSARLKIGRAA